MEGSYFQKSFKYPTFGPPKFNNARVAELVDASVSKTDGSNAVPVRFRSWVHRSVSVSFSFQSADCEQGLLLTLFFTVDCELTQSLTLFFTVDCELTLSLTLFLLPTVN